MPSSEPQFIETDPAVVLAEIIAAFETLADRTVLPAQAERLIINMIAAREILLRNAIQFAAKQNLVDYADFPGLQFLGDLVGVYREDAQPATCTIRFTLGADHGGTTIPSGARIATKDTKFTFITESDLTIPDDETTGDVYAVCDTDGIEGNGYEPTEVSSLLDPVAFIVSAENIDTTAGGAAQETKERMRERIKLAPAGFSTGGARSSYRYHALAAHPSVCDVAISNPQPGRVNVYPLTVNGLPDAGVLAAVEAALSDEKTRPLTDTVTVDTPTEYTFSITASLTLYASADQTDTLAAAEAAAEAIAADMRAKLGRDVVPDQIKKALMVDGVYSVTLTAPAAYVAGDTTWTNCTAVNVTIGGTVNG